MEIVWDILSQFGGLAGFFAALFAFYKFFIEKRLIAANVLKTKAETVQITANTECNEKKDLSKLNQDLNDQMEQMLKHGEVAEKKIRELEEKEDICQKKLLELEKRDKEREIECGGLHNQIVELMRFNEVRSREFLQLKKRFEMFENFLNNQ